MKSPIFKYDKVSFELIKQRLCTECEFIERHFINDSYCVFSKKDDSRYIVENLVILSSELEKYDLCSTIDEFVSKVNNIILLRIGAKIIPPEGMEMYYDGDNIRFRPKNSIKTYFDIAKELFLNKDSYYIGNYAHIGTWKAVREGDCYYSTICSSKEQAEKLLGINKLINTADYFNSKYQKDGSSFYYYSLKDNSVVINKESEKIFSAVKFNTRVAAEETLRVLGEELIISIFKD